MSQLLAKYVAELAGDLYSSGRWNRPDAPGSAHVPSLGDRVEDPGMLSLFRETEAGQYLLSAVKSYEDALNDDWMPVEIVGLPLDKAREFVRAIWEELQNAAPEFAVEKLRERYAQLSSS